MIRSNNIVRLTVFVLFIVASCGVLKAQRSGSEKSDVEFGAVMRAYLGYLRNEQEVVDDRASRREITQAYYRRNSNRIYALRQMAVRLVRQTKNDYVPELEAVAPDELGILFDQRPNVASLRANEIVGDKFRFLGAEHFGETFYLFARLDPYEQAELIQKHSSGVSMSSGNASGQRVGETSTRARRVGPK